MNKHRWVETLEYLALVGSGVGTVASVLYQQAAFASTPLSVALVLNLVNRRRLDGQVNDEVVAALDRLNQGIEQEVQARYAMQQQVLAMPRPDEFAVALESATQGVMTQAQQAINQVEATLHDRLTALEKQTIPSIQQDVLCVQEQVPALQASLMDVNTHLLDMVSNDRMNHVESSLGKIVAMLDEHQSSLQDLATKPATEIATLQEQLRALQQCFVNLPDGQALEQDIALLREEMDSLLKASLPPLSRQELSNALMEIAALRQAQQSLQSAQQPLAEAIIMVQDQINMVQDQVNMLAQAVDDRATAQIVETLHQELDQLSSRCDELHGQIHALLARTEGMPISGHDDVQAAIAAQVAGVQQDLTQRLEQLQTTIATLQTDVLVLQASAQSPNPQNDYHNDYHSEQHLDIGSSLKAVDVLLSSQPIDAVEGAGESVQTAAIVAASATTPQLNGSNASSGVPLSSDIGPDITTVTLPVLTPTHHHPQRQHHMITALATAQERVVISGNWFGSQGFDERLCRQVQTALNRGIIIEIDCVGLIDADRLDLPKRIHHQHHPVQPHHELVTGFHRLLELQHIYPQHLILKALGLQDWFIVCDRCYAVLPTLNYPQRPDESDESHQMPISNPTVVHSLLAQFEQPLVGLVTARAYSMRAAVHYELGDYDRALMDYADALQLNPYDAITYNNRGVIYYDLGDMRRAIADFDQALAIDTHHATIYANRGTVRAELGDHQGAIADYTCAIEQHPTDNITYNHRGLLRSRLGDRQGAIADYTVAIQLRPNDDVAYFNRGAARASLGDYEGAIADYSQAIRINPYFANAHNNRGFAQQKLGNWEAAIADFTQAIRISPNFTNAYNNRGITRSKLGDFQGAIADFDHVIRINPDFANAYNNRGTVLSKLGDIMGAITDFNQALAINPEFANAYSNRGLAYAELGNIDAAIDDVMKASRLFARQGDETSSQQALQKLKMLNQLKSGAGL